MPREKFRPDHGWSWVILVAGFFSCCIFDGVIFSFGIFLSDIAHYFDQGLGQTAWIGSTIGGIYALIGPVASVLANKFGCRAVTIAGSILASAGFFASSFSPTIWMMVLTYGIMGGIGFGLMYQCAYVMVGHYFEQRRALATGITACGSGVGIFLFGQLGEVMLTHYGWQGSMWLISGISLNGAVLGALYRPVPSMAGDRIASNGTVQKRKLLSLSVLKSPAFIIFGCSSFLCLIGFMVPFMYLPSYAELTGASVGEASMLISIIGITNTVGRILCGWISDKSWADPLKIYNASLIVGGTSTVACAWLTVFPLQATYAAVFGLSISCYVSLCAIILIEILGLEKLSNAFGFLNLFRGLATFIGAPLAGILYDATGQFNLAFYVAGTSIATAGVICLPLRMLEKCSGAGSSGVDDNEKGPGGHIGELKRLESDLKLNSDGYKIVPVDSLSLTVNISGVKLDSAISGSSHV